jgi:hypothetical protein
MIETSLPRLLDGTAAQLERIAAGAGVPDAYATAQLKAASEILRTLARRLDWSPGDALELQERVVIVARLAGDLGLTAGPDLRAVLVGPADRAASLRATVELLSAAGDAPPEIAERLRPAIEELLAWQLDQDLAKLRR